MVFLLLMKANSLKKLNTTKKRKIKDIEKIKDFLSVIHDEEIQLAEFATKYDIVDVIKKEKIWLKVRIINNKVTSNKTKHLEKPADLSEKFQKYQ